MSTVFTGSKSYPRHGKGPELAGLRAFSPPGSERSLSTSSSSSGIGQMDADSPESRRQFDQIANSLKQLNTHKCKLIHSNNSTLINVS